MTCLHKDLVNALLIAGAAINRKNEKGETGLHKASVGGHVDVVKLLLQKNPKINIARVSYFDLANHASVYLIASKMLGFALFRNLTERPRSISAQMLKFMIFCRKLY